MSDSKKLTTSAGAPVADNQNSITAGPRGPLLVQDYQLIEKLAHQNRERILDRQLGHFEKVHPDYAAGVRKALVDLA